GLWDELRREWAEKDGETRPPVFILVCKNTRIARVIYHWLAEGKPPATVPPAGLDELRNTEDRTVTIRVDTKVVQESDTEGAKSDEVAWMRFTLDTVGGRSGRAIVSSARSIPTALRNWQSSWAGGCI